MYIRFALEKHHLEIARDKTCSPLLHLAQPQLPFPPQQWLAQLSQPSWSPRGRSSSQCSSQIHFGCHSSALVWCILDGFICTKTIQRCGCSAPLTLCHTYAKNGLEQQKLINSPVLRVRFHNISRHNLDSKVWIHSFVATRKSSKRTKSTPLQVEMASDQG